MALAGDQELDDWWVGSEIIDPDDEGTLTVSVTDLLPANATGVRVDVWVSTFARLGTGLLRTKEVPDTPIWVDPMQGRVIAAFTAELLDVQVTA